MSLINPSTSSSSRPLPPHPELWWWIGRIVVVILCLVWMIGIIWADPLQVWAAEQQRTETNPLRLVVADLVQRITVPGGGMLAWVPLLALVALLGELVLALLTMSRMATMTTTGVCQTYRIRPLSPLIRTKTPEYDPAELWTALLTALATVGSDRVACTISRVPNLPATVGVQIRGRLDAQRPPRPPHPSSRRRPAGRRVGVPPQGRQWLDVRRWRERWRRLNFRQWFAVQRWRERWQDFRRRWQRTPSASPRRPRVAVVQELPSLPLDQRRAQRGPLNPAAAPAVGGDEPTSVATARRALEGVLRAVDDTIALEPWHDPFDAVQPGMVLVSQEVRLALAPHWSLRVPDTDEGGVLRALIRSLAVPAGVVVQEVQIIPNPVNERMTHRWYARGRYWYTRMRSREGMALNPTAEIKHLTRKLGEAHAAVTIRLVAVAASSDPAHLAAARSSLDVMRSALAGLEAVQQLPYAAVRQYLTPIQRPWDCALRRTAPHFPPAFRWLRAGARLVSFVTILLVVGLALSYGHLWQTWGAMPPIAQQGMLGLGLTTIVLAGVTSTWHYALVQPWMILRRVARRRAHYDPFLLPVLLWRQPPILGSAEVGQLWRPPDPRSGAEVAWTPNRILAAPASAFVPNDLHLPDATGRMRPQWLTLGHAFDSAGALRPVGVPLKALHQMMHITAGMGAGKSQAAAAMAAQLIPWGFIILDGKGDDEGGSLASVVARLIPPEEEHRLFILNVLETAFPISLNPLYAYTVAMEYAPSKPASDLAFNAALGLVMGLFERLDPGRWHESPGMQQYALMGAHLVLRTGTSQPGDVPTMAKIARVLEDDTYRSACVVRYPFKRDIVYRFWTERVEGLAESQKSSLQALLRRLDLFMANPITRPMLTVEIPSVDLLKAMETGQIIIIPMPHRTLGGLAPLVGMLILQSIVAAAYARPGDALSRETAPVFIDEVQVFIADGKSPDLEQAFTQLRGFAVPMVILHQSLDQLGDLEPTVLTNAANRLILRTSEPDASTYAKLYSHYGLTPEDIKGMEALHHQYAVTLGPNREQLVFSLRPNAWPTPPPMHDMPIHLGPRAWQQVVAPTNPAWSPEEVQDRHALDRALIRIIYEPSSPTQYDHVAGQLALLPESSWHALLAQWSVLRTTHTHYILTHPGVIPHQPTRQAWVSKLTASRGAILEEVITMRQDLKMVQQGAQPAPAALPPLKAPSPDQPASIPPRIDMPDAEIVAALRQRPPRPDEMPEIAAAFEEDGEDR
ncbi:MAG: ATP-binding protein [Candidatus Viridilinea halotolerans]|uniref:ATP-binding protein n=1 Tax=Candidatus Viridilinea halotolerans TaxID=2491704 RepID=A0A426U6W5_9CHLR|nr:MAG: ATP-binding protein [Candidatus Viridilinea halotolerans]